MWSVIEFKKDKSVVAVPSCWIFGNEKYVYWPPYSNKKAQLDAAVKHLEEPGVLWAKWRIKIWVQAFTSLKAARKEAERIILNAETSSAASSGHDSQESNSENDDLSSLTPFLSLNDEGSNKFSDNTLIGEQVIHASSKPDMIPSDISIELKSDIKFIKREIVKVKQYIQDINTSLMDLRKNSEDILGKIPFDVPINNLITLTNVEQLLQTEANRATTVLYLNKIGGRNVQDCTYRVLNRLLDIKLCCELNWAGRFGKTGMKLEFSNLVAVIKESVQTFCKCDEKEVENRIKDYLRTAKDRAGLRKKSISNEKRNDADVANASISNNSARTENMPSATDKAA